MPRLAAGLRRGDDGVVRCSWAGDDPLYRRYHDEEWGFPVADDRRLFEKICLEGFQSGLSWLTILRKRESFRAAFCGFDAARVARFRARRRRAPAEGRRDRPAPRQDRVDGQQRPARARAARPSPASLAAFVWSFEPPPADRPKRAHLAGPANDAEDARRRSPSARRCKKRGWSFVGPTTAYAFMQAMGLVNDHVEGCAVRERVEAARARFKRPR